MASRILLFAGIPASGKSTFARWLASEKGYRHLDVDFAEADFDEWMNKVRRSQWNGVIDWGFPPHCLDLVSSLVELGVEPWWFDGERDAARQSFLARLGRGEHPSQLEAYEHQMAEIEAAWPDIERVFWGRMIHSVAAGPRYLSAEEILCLIAD